MKKTWWESLLVVTDHEHNPECKWWSGIYGKFTEAGFEAVTWIPYMHSTNWAIQRYVGGVPNSQLTLFIWQSEANEQRELTIRDTINVGLDSSVGKAPVWYSGGRCFKSATVNFSFVHLSMTKIMNIKRSRGPNIMQKGDPRCHNEFGCNYNLVRHTSPGVLDALCTSTFANDLTTC